MLVRSGYHPVVAGPGYNVYYLNFLAGTSRTLAVTEDPNHVWLKSTWKEIDPRLPTGAVGCRKQPTEYRSGEERNGYGDIHLEEALPISA